MTAHDVPHLFRRYRVVVAPVVNRPDLEYGVEGELVKISVTYHFRRPDGSEARVNAKCVRSIEEIR